MGSNWEKSSDWGENLLNVVATNTLRHLFTHSDRMEVTIRCYPSAKLLQGSIDSFRMTGEGLEIQREFRTESLSLETDAVSLDFTSVLKGQLTLKQPTQAIAQVKLTQKDINQAFKAELVRKRLENLTLPPLLEVSGGEAVSFKNIHLELLPQNQIKLKAQAEFAEKTIPMGLTCTLKVEKRRKIRFSELKVLTEEIPKETATLSHQFTSILGTILDEMIDLDRFNLEGIVLRINRLETQGVSLLFSGFAQINYIPQKQ